MTTGQEPAAFYVLKLGAASTTYTVRGFCLLFVEKRHQSVYYEPYNVVQFSKFTNGMELVLGSTIPNVCTVSTTAWVRVVFSITGSTLSATCNGFNLGSVTDTTGNTLYTGTAGLFHHPNPTIVTNPNVSATAIPPGTHARFRNVVITRGCDGPGGGCSQSLPGESCTMGCVNGVSAPASTSSLVVTCSVNGTWSAPRKLTV